MKQTFLEALGIFLFTIAIAFTANYVRSDGLSLVREGSARQPRMSEGGEAETILSLEAFLNVRKHPGVVILDARPADDFEQAHIPGARSLPESDWAKLLPRVLQNLSFDHEIVVYCSGIECESAEEVAARLQEVGYSNVKVYAGGWDEWEEHDLPFESNH